MSDPTIIDDLLAQKATVITLGAAAFSFLLIFPFVACCQSNEITIAKRFIGWLRLTIALLFLSHLFLLQYDSELVNSYNIKLFTYPSYPVLKPIAGIIFCFLGWFPSSHQAMRWVVRVA